MNYKLPISSARLRYEQLSEEDVVEWTAFFIDNPNLKYVGIANPGKPEEDAQKWVGRQLQRYKDNGWGYLKMVDKATGAVVGHTGLLLKDVDGEEVLEIGYSIIPKYWGQGYASEGAIRMREYMEEHKPKNKAISIIHIDNIGSQKVALRNGMTRGKTWEYLDMPVYIYEVSF